MRSAEPAPDRREASLLLDHALGYVDAGWPVLPVRPRGKAPLTGRGLKDATRDRQTVVGWWRRWPDANIGLAVPAGLSVLDLDSDDALHRLKAEGKVLPATARARTARGYHFWYRTPGPVRNRVDLLPGVDLRAAGGYVVAPPSIHPSGAVYRWEVPLDRSTLAEAPEWLSALLADCDGSPERPPGHWHRTISQPVPRGRRNQTLAEVAGLLFRRLPADVAAELALCWARVKLQPPLPEREVLRTIDSIAGRELRRQGGER